MREPSCACTLSCIRRIGGGVGLLQTSPGGSAALEFGAGVGVGEVTTTAGALEVGEEDGPPPQEISPRTPAVARAIESAKGLVLK
jgi:hypothetical protein